MSPDIGKNFDIGVQVGKNPDERGEGEEWGGGGRGLGEGPPDLERRRPSANRVTIIRDYCIEIIANNRV
jgi:hypothetical protein